MPYDLLRCYYIVLALKLWELSNGELTKQKVVSFSHKWLVAKKTTTQLLWLVRIMWLINVSLSTETSISQVHPHDHSDLGNVRNVGVAASVGHHVLIDITDVKVLSILHMMQSNISTYHHYLPTAQNGTRTASETKNWYGWTKRYNPGSELIMTHVLSSRLYGAYFRYFYENDSSILWVHCVYHWLIPKLTAE